MRQIALAATAALAALAAVRADAADLSGRWSTQSSGGVVEIAACGEALCGTLVDSPYLRFDPGLRDRRNKDRELRARPLMGLTILSGFSGGPDGWREGQIYNPDTGRTYAGALEAVSADELRVTGCAAARRCVHQVWRRLPRP